MRSVSSRPPREAQGSGVPTVAPPTAALAPGLVPPLLEVSDLSVEFALKAGPLRAVRSLSYTISAGESLGLVGESGSGKSVSALAVLGLLNKRTATVSGSVRLEGRELIGLSEGELRSIRARRAALVFQDPLSSLNPVLSIGRQITEVLEAHRVASGAAARKRAIELLDLVGIPDPERRVRQYPHELSGGMRQRAMLAAALACEPALLIADEPTTALDVTIQAQILELLVGLRTRLNMSLLLITHDLGVVAGFTDRIAVMYAGRVVEQGPTENILDTPRHPYTRGLLASVPRIDQPREGRLAAIPGAPLDLFRTLAGCSFEPRCAHALDHCRQAAPPLEPDPSGRAVACWRAAELDATTRAQKTETGQPHPEAPGSSLVTVRDLRVWFPVRAGLLRRTVAWVQAVDGVSFDIARGETMALVGESGSGKTTVGRALVRANEPRSGSVRIAGHELLELHGSQMQARRRQAQMVFQDPYASLDPRQTVGQILAEPLRVHGTRRDERPARIAQLLQLVGLDPGFSRRYPHQFSGGQRQRIGIARALAVEPDLIVCDEPISSLDVSIQAQIVNLLRDVQGRLGVSYLLIAHDLAVVRHLAHRVAVMYLGVVVELASADELYARPLHPYTLALLSAAPVPDTHLERARRRTILIGDVPSPVKPPSGCRFHTRCPLRARLGNPTRCVTEQPMLERRGAEGGGHLVACHFPEAAGTSFPTGTEMVPLVPPRATEG
jgi:peptide/nickel transport system ATP-binding protein